MKSFFLVMGLIYLGGYLGYWILSLLGEILLSLLACCLKKSSKVVDSFLTSFWVSKKFNLLLVGREWGSPISIDLIELFLSNVLGGVFLAARPKVGT